MKIKIPNLFIALAWLVLPTLVSAQFSFTTNNEAITITGYNTAAGLNVVIPAAINGYPVNGIGYPERFAQEALEHNSKAVHRAYAKRALMKIPSLEDYEKTAIK